jgi:hypothetical protein
LWSHGYKRKSRKELRKDGEGVSERREEKEGVRRTEGGRGGLNLKEHNSRGKEGIG